jgi:transposase
VLPAQFRVLVTKRPKLGPGVVLQASAPERLVPGGLLTKVTVAQVLVARYAHHLPLYRQAQMLARQGLTLGREVLADWLGTAALESRPVVRRLRKILLTSPRLFADETTLPVLDPGRGKVKGVRLGSSARRPDLERYRSARVVFRYAPGHGQEHAKVLLAGYHDIVQCDGYAAYRVLAGGGDATLAFCWAHVRRGFYDLAKGGAAPIAAEVLQRIAALYAIEAEIRGRPAADLLAVRQARSRPLVAALFTWLDAQLRRLPRSSPTAEAIRYAMNHRKGLEQFLYDGRIETDTNIVERAIRPLCCSRKNALFASGDDGGARWAAIASLVETCKLNGVDPQRYFTDLLTPLVNGWPNSRIDELCHGAGPSRRPAVKRYHVGSPDSATAVDDWVRSNSSDRKRRACAQEAACCTTGSWPGCGRHSAL